MLICTFIGLGLAARFGWSAWENHIEAEEAKMRKSCVLAHQHQLGAMSHIYSESNLDAVIESIDRESVRVRSAARLPIAA